MPIDVNISTTFLGDTDTPNTYVGAGGYKVKVKADETGLEFLADTGGSDTNIMYNDLTATADRSQNMDSKSLTFINGKQFKFIANVAPPAGEGSFDFKGNGNTSGNILFRLINSSSDEVLTINGLGNIGLGTAPVSSQMVRLLDNGSRMGYFAATTGGKAGYFDSQHENAVYARSTNEPSVFAQGDQDWASVSIAGSAGLGHRVTGKFQNISPLYADNASALAGGLSLGDAYHTSAGVRMEVI